MAYALDFTPPRVKTAWLPVKTEDEGWVWLRFYCQQMVWPNNNPGQWWFENRVQPRK